VTFKRDAIREDLDSLSQVGHRFAGTAGERGMLHLVKARLASPERARIEGFVAFTSPGFVIGAHALLLLVAGVLGLRAPLVAAVVCAFASASLVAEGLGLYSVVRRVLPKSPSYNLVWRQAAVGEAIGSVVVSTPIDVPRWRRKRARWLKRPMQLVLGAAVVLTVALLMRALAQPWGRPTQAMVATSVCVLVGAVWIGAALHRRSPEVHELATGPAALLELVRRLEADPPPGLDVWAVWTGCGHAYQNGMHAFLAMRGPRLRQPALVVALDDPGRPALRALASEGPLWPLHHRPTGPALVERLRWGGLQIALADSSGSTDARAARLWGHRAVALSGGQGAPTLDDTVRAVDVADALCRLYAEDLRRAPAAEQPNVIRTG
jgi:hypothetical protein